MFCFLLIRLLYIVFVERVYSSYTFTTHTLFKGKPVRTFRQEYRIEPNDSDQQQKGPSV